MAKHRKKRSIERVCTVCNTVFTTGCGSKLICSPVCRIKVAEKIIDDRGCWNWIKSVNPMTGYGQLSAYENGKHELYTAHRTSYLAHIGAIPDGLCVLHKCDNRKCFNPDHLFLGTQKENMDDMDSKGRRVKGKPSFVWQERYPDRVPRGDKHHLKINGTGCLMRGMDARRSNLTDDNIREIRASKETLASLSKRFSVSQSALCAIRKRKTWRHID